MFLCFVIVHMLQVCVLERVAGLQASVLTQTDDCLDSPDITVGVSLERGAPVLLLFLLLGDNNSFSQIREMNTRRDIFHIGRPIPGMEDISKNVRLNCNTIISVTTNLQQSEQKTYIYICFLCLRCACACAVVCLCMCAVLLIRACFHG